MPDTHDNIKNPRRVATIWTREIIQAKLQAMKYARSNCIRASMLAEKYAGIASELEAQLPGGFFDMCDSYYSKDRKGAI